MTLSQSLTRHDAAVSEYLEALKDMITRGGNPMEKRSAIQQVIFERAPKPVRIATRKRIRCSHCRRWFETDASLLQHFKARHVPAEERFPGEEGGDGDWYNDPDMGAR